MTAQARGKRKIRVGTVVSDRMKKTIVVDVGRIYSHSLYGKAIRATSRCYVHDEREEARPGDLVRIAESRPLSRMKRWRLIGIVKKGSSVEAGASLRRRSETGVRKEEPAGQVPPAAGEPGREKA